jgi:hypothetical protein
MTDDQTVDEKQLVAALLRRLEDEAEQTRRNVFFAPAETFPAPTAEFSRPESGGDEVDWKLVDEIVAGTSVNAAEVARQKRSAAVEKMKQTPTGRMMLAQQRVSLRCGIGCGMSEADFNELLKRRGLSF